MYNPAPSKFSMYCHEYSGYLNISNIYFIINEYLKYQNKCMYFI